MKTFRSERCFIEICSFEEPLLFFLRTFALFLDVQGLPKNRLYQHQKDVCNIQPSPINHYLLISSLQQSSPSPHSLIDRLPTLRPRKSPVDRNAISSSQHAQPSTQEVTTHNPNHTFLMPSCLCSQPIAHEYHKYQSLNNTTCLNRNKRLLDPTTPTPLRIKAPFPIINTRLKVEMVMPILTSDS